MHKLQDISVPPAAPLGKVRLCLIIQSMIQPTPGCLAMLQQDELPTRLAHCGHLLQLQGSTLTMPGTHRQALQQDVEYIINLFWDCETAPVVRRYAPECSRLKINGWCKYLESSLGILM